MKRSTRTLRDEPTCLANNYDRPCCAKYKPTEGGFKPRPTSGLPDELDRDIVKRGVASVKAFVDQCGEQHTAKGIVTIAMRVQPDGRVAEASVADSPDAALGACVAAAMKRARFGKTAHGGEFRYPFKF